MKKMTLMMSAAALVAGGNAFAQDADMPPAAQPGECFARVLIPEITEVVAEQVVDQPERTEIKVIPATYETITEQVITKEEQVIYDVIPAQYETVTEQVLVEPERVELVPVPATYRTITEQVLVEPERTETIVVPAVTETYTEQVLVRPAYATWKPGTGLFGRGAAGTGTAAAAPGAGTEVTTGELLCRVEVPAEYATVTRTRVAQPETTQTNLIPAVFETVTKQVIDQPPRVEERVIPARFETVTKEVEVSPAQVVERVIPAEMGTVQVRKLVSPAMEDVIVIPATYKTVEKRVVTGGGGLEWRDVLCEVNTTPEKIAEIQRALTARGYAAPADGAFGPQTLRSMESFQRDNGLPVGYLTVSTAEALGVSPY